VHAVAAVVSLILAGCGASPITGDRVERAMAPTFANLVHAQLQRMGLGEVPAAQLRVVASCYRVGGAGAGAGEWTCTVVWAGPRGTTLRDTYDLTVGANGCYTATLTSSGEATLGGPIVMATDGRQVRNLLYAFDGCFDTM
jgi:hypothetical protein